MVQPAADDIPSDLPDTQFSDAPLPRPPTPPKESPRALAVPKGPVDDVLAAANGNTVTVPFPSSPRDLSPPATSSAEQSPPQSTKRSVKWSPWTTYHKPDSTLSTPSRKLPPSASTDPKSLKSILKPFSPFPASPSPALDHPLAAHTHASFPSMLESVVTALGSPERSTKLDTYITFCNTLKAYDEVPDVHAMEAKMPVLLSYLKRDMQARLEDGGNPDSQLVQQAIKLLTILCWTPRLVNCIDDASATYFVQHAIEKIENPATSKYSINLYLHYIAQQKFPVKIMTTERCNRIISTLENLDQRVTGKSISKERIDVYHRLLLIAKPVMLTRAGDWMDHAFSALLSGVKEVRNRALGFMGDVAKIMGGEKKVGQAITRIFSRPAREGKMFEQIRQRLEHFVKHDGEGIYVARMWAVVLLLVQGRDHWEFFNPWLRVIELCFNVSEKEVKVEAQMAWSKVIYTMDIGPGTTRKLLQLLCKPLEQYLDPKFMIANTRKPRKAAMVNVAVLMYYGFRPGSPYSQLSEIWDVVVVGLVERLALKSAEEVTDAAALLCAVLDGVHKPWTEQRVLNTPTLKADELPRLDPRWVRMNCETVLKTVQQTLWKTSWKAEEPEVGARLLWTRFVKTLADAANMEIKVSAEQMETVSCLFNMFQRVWNTGPEILADIPPRESVSFIQAFTFLVLRAVEALGKVCFTEKLLALDIEHARFSAASTPTHKGSSEGNGLKYPPILHIFRLLVHPPQGILINEEYIDCGRAILAKCVTSQDSRRKKLQLLAACETLLSRRAPQKVEYGLWTVLAELTLKSLPMSQIQRNLMSPSPNGGEHRDAVSVLKWGVCQDVEGWEGLFGEVAGMVQAEMGEREMAGQVIEPLAEGLRYCKGETDMGLMLRRARLLFEKAAYSKPKPRVENTLRAHFGIVERRTQTNESFENLFAVADDLLKKNYNPSLPLDIKQAAVQLLAAIEAFIARSPTGTIAPLKQMQDGLGLWVKDDLQILTPKSGIQDITADILWTKLLRAIDALPRHDSLALSNVCALVASGLESRRKSTVTLTVKSWNATYGKQESLTYPRRIRNALRRLRTVADISLPTFPQDGDDDGILTPPEFEDTQPEESKDNDCIFSSPPKPVERTTPLVKETPGLLMKGRRRSMTPGKQTPMKRMTPLKLKHQDSQLEFTAIEGAVPPADVESQLATEHQKETRERQRTEAAIFPSMAVSTPTRKPRRQSSASKLDDTPHLPATTPDLQEQPPLTMVPDTNLKPRKGEELVSFVSESSMAGTPSGTPSRTPILTAYSSNIPRDTSTPTRAPDPMMLDRRSASPAKSPLKSSPIKPTPTSQLSTPPSVADFADATPTLPPPPTANTTVDQDLEGDISPLKDISELAVSVTPRKPDDVFPTFPTNPSTPSRTLFPTNSPEAQILAEATSASATPAPPSASRRRKSSVATGRKRKRVSTAPNHPDEGSDVGEAIIVAAEEPAPKRVKTPAARRTATRRSVRGKPEQPAEKSVIVPPSPSARQLDVSVEIAAAAPPAKRTRSAAAKVPAASAEALETASSSLSSVPSSQEGPVEVREGGAEAAEKPAEKAVKMLREALGLLEKVDVEMEGIAEVEDEVFDAFTRLRRRRRSQGVGTPGSVRSAR